MRAQMGSVQQNNFLFAGTVIDNIRFARPQATEVEVRDTLKALDCLDLLENLPQGLQTQVGEKSAALSVGQRQLISFARALLADPRILILDEATSSVDTQTERIIQHALATLLKGRTSFVIAHRLSTVVSADRILVISDGRIAEQGTHAELLRLGGHYYRLYTQQFRHDMETQYGLAEAVGVKEKEEAPEALAAELKDKLPKRSMADWMIAYNLKTRYLEKK